MAQQAQWSTLSGLAHRVAQRKAPIFTGYPEFDVEDLYHEAIHAMMGAIPAHDPGRGSLSTWLYLVASRRLIDLWRRRSKQWAREEKTALLPFRDGPPPEEKSFDLADWCRGRRRLCERMYQGQTTRLGLRVFPTPALAVLSLLMVATGLTGDAVTVLLDHRPDLLDAMGWDGHPGREVCRRVWSRTKSRTRDSEIHDLGTVALN